MGNLYDYIQWRGDLPFSEVPLNEVDGLILSLISYIPFDGIVPGEHGTFLPMRAVATAFFSEHPDPKKISLGVLVPKDIVKLFYFAKNSKRFRNVGISAFVNRIEPEREMQFSAITYQLEDGTTVVTFRGTDDTIVGWKENCNMTFCKEVPSQRVAVEYLNRAAGTVSGNIVVTGHSKGGNLAVFATTYCDPKAQEKIVCTYNMDGQGFQQIPIFTDPAYLSIRSKIKTFIPQHSIVGILMKHDQLYSAIKSSQNGILQHDGLTWEVMGGSFMRIEKLGAEIEHADRYLNDWISDLTPEERKSFSDSLYALFTAGGAATLTDIMNDKTYWLKKCKELNPEILKTAQTMFASLWEANRKNIVSEFLSKNTKSAGSHTKK